MTQGKKNPEISLVVAFSNCEESIGRRMLATASHLRAFGRPFEIIAVNEGSHDNALAILSLVAQEMDELRLVTRDCSGRVFTRGAVEARAPVLVLTANHSDAEMGPWASLGWALGRLDAGRDAVVNRGRFVVARRSSCLPAIARVGGNSRLFGRRFERFTHGLHVDVVGSARPELPFAELRAALLDPLRRLESLRRLVAVARPF